jgi:SsrA-binding protein
MAEENRDLVSNRKAFYQYEVLDTYEAGIALLGTEIKSLRAHGGSLQEAYVKVLKGELWLIGCSIAPYRYGNIHNHEERRERKLLMHGYEIEKIRRQVQEKGVTLIPIAFYLKKGRVKVKIGIARGKKGEDKRAAIKEREDKRSMQRMIRRGGED